MSNFSTTTDYTASDYDEDSDIDTDFVENPDSLYQSNSITFTYDDHYGLKFQHYPNNHNNMIRALYGDDYTRKHQRDYEHEIILGRFAPREYDNNRTGFIAIWNKNRDFVVSALPDCLKAMSDTFGVDGNVKLLTPLTGTTTVGRFMKGVAKVTNQSPEDEEKWEKARQMHLARGQEKKDLMKAVGVGGQKKRSEWTSAMQKAGHLAPGHSLYTMHSESKSKDDWLKEKLDGFTPDELYDGNDDKDRCKPFIILPTLNIQQQIVYGDYGDKHEDIIKDNYKKWGLRDPDAFYEIESISGRFGTIWFYNPYSGYMRTGKRVMIVAFYAFDRKYQKLANRVIEYAYTKLGQDAVVCIQGRETQPITNFIRSPAPKTWSGELKRIGKLAPGHSHLAMHSESTFLDRLSSVLDGRTPS